MHHLQAGIPCGIYCRCIGCENCHGAAPPNRKHGPPSQQHTQAGQPNTLPNTLHGRPDNAPPHGQPRFPQPHNVKSQGHSAPYQGTHPRIHPASAVQTGLQFGPQYGLNRNIPTHLQPPMQQGSLVGIPTQGSAPGSSRPQGSQPKLQHMGGPGQYQPGHQGQLARYGSTPHRPTHQAAGPLQRHASAPFPPGPDPLHHAAATPSQAHPPSRQLAHSLSSQPSTRNPEQDAFSQPQGGCTASSVQPQRCGGPAQPQLNHPSQSGAQLQPAGGPYCSRGGSGPQRSILDNGLQNPIRQGSLPLGTFPQNQGRPAWTINELQPGPPAQPPSWHSHHPAPWPTTSQGPSEMNIQGGGLLQGFNIKSEAPEAGCGVQGHALPKQYSPPGDSGMDTDSPPGMPTPPNVQQPPPPPIWNSDDRHGIASEPHQQAGYEPGCSSGGLPHCSQQSNLEQQQGHSHMPISPFKDFDPAHSGSESGSMGEPPHVVGVLETQQVVHPLQAQQAHGDALGGLARTMSCFPDTQQHHQPWDSHLCTSNLLSRCNSAPALPEVSCSI